MISSMKYQPKISEMAVYANSKQAFSSMGMQVFNIRPGPVI